MTSPITSAITRPITWPVTSPLGTVSGGGGVPGIPAWVLSGSSLDIDFADNDAWGTDIAATTPGAVLTVSRASAAFSRDSAGLFTSFPANTLRQTDLGVLIEDAATNVVQRNTDPSLAAWTKANSAILIGQASPDGGTTAFRFSDNAASAGHNLQAPAFAFVSGTTYCFSAIAKASTSSFVQISCPTANFTDPGYANFNLAAGTKTASGGTLVGSDIEDLGGGWYLCWITVTCTASAAGAAIIFFRINSGTAVRGVSYVGTGTGVFLWSPQAEVNSRPSSPILNTTDASLTRAADNITPTASAQALMDAAKSAYAEFSDLRGGTAPRVVDFAGTASLRASAGPDGTTVATVGASTATATIGGSQTVSDLVKASFSFDGTDNTALANGGDLVTTAGAWGVTNEMPTIGNSAALTSGLNGYLVRLAFSATPANFDGVPVTYIGGSLERTGVGIGYYNFDKPLALELGTLLRDHVAFTAYFPGDSTYEGIHTAGTSLRSNSIVSQLAIFMAAHGWATSDDSFMGDANIGSTSSYVNYNGKVTGFAAGWSVSGTESPGGKAFTDTTNTGDITFVPADDCTALDVITLDPSAASVNVKFNGVSQGNITMTGAGPIKVTRFTGSATSITVNRVSGNVFVVGCIARDLGVPRIDFVNAGRGSSGSAFWADSSSLNRPRYGALALQPKVVFINQYIGEWGDASGVTSATTKANIELQINDVLGYGGIPALVIAHPTPTSIASAARQSEWIDVAGYELADEYELPLFDMHAHFNNTYGTAVSLGYTYDVSSHYNAAGYLDEAEYIGAGLLRLAS